LAWLQIITASLQFDIQGFFNNINYNRLVHTFHCLGFTENICNWLSSFLTDRTVCLKFNAHTSEPIDIATGAPQGSPISPVLSIIYTADLLSKAEKWTDAKMFMFIDDGNILALGPSYQIITKTLIARYSECLDWLHKVGLSIESEKTEVIFYSPHKPRPNIHCKAPKSLRLDLSNSGK